MKQIKAAVIGFLFFVGLLLTVVDWVAFDPNLFLSSYRKENTMEVIGMSESDLMKSSNALLDYLRDKRSDIVVNATVNGFSRNVFDERETKHMVDVKNLYQAAVKVRWFCLIVVVLAFVLEKVKKDSLWALGRESFKSGLLVFGLLLMGILMYALLDFYSFWMNFHYLFFDNDLFLLDPNVSLMINMFPESFFFGMVIRIIGLVGVLVLVLALVLFLLGRRKI